MTRPLSPLEHRGWVLAAWGPDDDGYDVHLHRPSTADRHGAEIQAFHEHQATAERMAVVAAVTADGHDLLELLRAALELMPRDTPGRESWATRARAALPETHQETPTR